jgi:hypothetical protein
MKLYCSSDADQLLPSQPNDVLLTALRCLPVQEMLTIFTAVKCQQMKIKIVCLFDNRHSKSVQTFCDNFEEFTLNSLNNIYTRYLEQYVQYVNGLRRKMETY